MILFLIPHMIGYLSFSHDFVISNRTFDGIGYERKKKGAGCVEAGIWTMDQSLCRPFEQLELKWFLHYERGSFVAGIRTQNLYFSRPDGATICTKSNEEFSYYDGDCIDDPAARLAVSYYLLVSCRFETLALYSWAHCCIWLAASSVSLCFESLDTDKFFCSYRIRTSHHPIFSRSEPLWLEFFSATFRKFARVKLSSTLAN